MLGIVILSASDVSHNVTVSADMTDQCRCGVSLARWRLPVYQVECQCLLFGFPVSSGCRCRRSGLLFTASGDSLGSGPFTGL